MFHWSKESFYDISDLQSMLNPDILWQLFEFCTNNRLCNSNNQINLISACPHLENYVAPVTLGLFLLLLLLWTL